MPNRYPHFRGGVAKKLKILNLKFAWISDPTANTMQTAVGGESGNGDGNYDFDDCKDDDINAGANVEVPHHC